MSTKIIKYLILFNIFFIGCTEYECEYKEVIIVKSQMESNLFKVYYGRLENSSLVRIPTQNNCAYSNDCEIGNKVIIPICKEKKRIEYQK